MLSTEATFKVSAEKEAAASELAGAPEVAVVRHGLCVFFAAAAGNSRPLHSCPAVVLFVSFVCMQLKICRVSNKANMNKNKTKIFFNSILTF